jgi:hypothetical protein
MQTRVRCSAMMHTDDYFKNEYLGEFDLDSVNVSVCRLNVYILKRLISEVGFPGEHKIGVMDYQIDWRNDKSYPDNFSLDIVRIFLHDRCAYQILKVELLQALAEGEIYPSEYAYIYEWSFHSLKHDNWATKYVTYENCNKDLVKDRFYNVGIYEEDYIANHSLVDSYRKDIGMVTIDVEDRLVQMEKSFGFEFSFGLYKVER